MTSTATTLDTPNAQSWPPIGFLERDCIVAKAGFNRWLVPPAALAVHLCIGMAYGFSVFWLPLSRLLGGDKSIVCSAGSGILDALFTTTCDWKVSQLGWTYTLFFVFLGSSAAIWGGWLERSGPRKAGFVAAICWSFGLMIASLGVIRHQLWLVWLGTGAIGGVGLGLGYISPISTLIKWFPDRRGMATGMAIMGFGGGAMIGAPLANKLMLFFRTPSSPGVWETFVVLGVVYLVFMMGGAFGYRIPPAGWRPEGWSAQATKRSMITTRHVHMRDAHKTLAFWLLWAVLCLNVSAGIGVLGMASPMLQEIFGGALIGSPQVGFTELSSSQRAAVATMAAGFAGMLSLFNIGGRFLWASLSDRLGRKATYNVFFLLGIALYASTPRVAHSGYRVLFIADLCLIVSMYGGGFSTIPAYLADIFGTQFVGPIHGRLLTAWSTAGIVGPVVVNYVREAQIAAGVPRGQVYDFTMYILAGMLVLGLIANLLVRPVAEKWYMKEEDVVALQARSAILYGDGKSYGIGRGRMSHKVVLAWLAVGIPIVWGVWNTVASTRTMFS
jgi:MFS family permease